jgi:DNA polymerase (family 10)
MENHEIAKVLDEVADMLEVSEDNFFRVRAYRNAARTIRDFPTPLARMSSEELQDLPGIGEDLAGKITVLIKSGELPLHRQLSHKVPPGLVALTHLPGLGPKRVRLLSHKLRIRDLKDLKRAIEGGRLRAVRGFGPKICDSLAAAIIRQAQAPKARMLYSEAAAIANKLLDHLRGARAVARLDAAGSVRRRKETIGDLDIVAAAADPGAIMDRLVSFSGVKEVLDKGETKTAVVLAGDVQVDLRVVPPESYGAALLYFTGSQAHDIHLRRIAQERGMLLNEYGLFRGKRRVAAAEEKDVYMALGLEWIPPELREDRGEIEAAAKGELPRLISRGDLRGDLHTHSSYTDGRVSIKEMAAAAHELGMEYLAITDHSKRVAMAHGLNPAGLRKQRKEIERIQKEVGIRLLRGTEVDILDDGTLDLPDDALAELDWVVASAHYKLAQTSRDMTRRLIRAIRNPNVDVIGHPSGRLLGEREASSFDLGEVLRAAREEGCALELDSQAERLDLTDTACLSAKREGVKIVISSDAHHPHEFAMLDYGINQARRGWIEPADVLNTRVWEKFPRRGR